MPRAARREHEVAIIQVPRFVVQRKDVEFEVKGMDGKKMGELHVSQGGVEWRPVNQRRNKKRNWEEFAEWIERRA